MIYLSITVYARIGTNWWSERAYYAHMSSILPRNDSDAVVISSNISISAIIVYYCIKHKILIQKFDGISEFNFHTIEL